MSSPQPETARIPAHFLWLGLALLAALGYLFQLGGDHIPRNGDELVYAHIARLTAESGHWLPLVSTYDFMRNTKPPLLFWQAIVTGSWGQHWSLLNLRLPSVLYVWATAAMLGFGSWNIFRQQVGVAPPAAAGRDAPNAVSVGAIAALSFLCFFSTYRYGRPYLTSAPETFWLSGVFFALAWSPRLLLASRWKFPLFAGLVIGIGCLYKSFAMVAPVGLALALCYQIIHARRAPWQVFRPGVLGDALKTLAICTLALAVFSLWFVLDPLPGEVWREFVVGENAGKFKSGQSYLSLALSGSGGIPVILTGYFVNAGLLLPLALGSCWAAWRGWRTRRLNGDNITDAEKVMWLWLLALALVFMLPSQRSARYLIPAMPAVAVLIALYWSRIGRLWFSLTLLLALLGTLAIASIAYGAVKATVDSTLYSPLFWILLAFMLIGALTGLCKPLCAPLLTLPCSFAFLLAMAWVTAPFNGPLGHFKDSTITQMQGQPVRVPNNFNGQFERYQFLLPGAKIMAYDAPQAVDYSEVATLLQTSPYALVQRRVGQPPCARCRIIDVRWDIRSRQAPEEGRWAAFTSPDTFWYSREYLVARPAP